MGDKGDKTGDKARGDRMKLTAARVKSLSKTGKYADGGGLYLVVQAGGSKSWMLRTTIDSKRREIGLGGYPSVSLAQARKRAAESKTDIQNGINPIVEKRRAATPTFSEAAHKVHILNLPTWSNPKHGEQWINTLKTYAFPVIGDMPIDTIRKGDCLSVLLPIWTAKPETAARVRQRLGKVFKWAMAHDYLEYNPAGEAISEALPKVSRLKAHHRALPYQECAAALDMIDASRASASAKLCFRFIVLTACRSGEARDATWDEIDIDTATWIIPAGRMKARNEHRVALSSAALEILKAAQELADGSGLIFPSPMKHGASLSDMTLTKLLRNNGLAERATMHGFRTSFRVWAEECTGASHAAKELALAHAVGNQVEQAYMRSDLLEQRRPLMDNWAEYLAA